MARCYGSRRFPLWRGHLLTRRGDPCPNLLAGEMLGGFRRRLWSRSSIVLLRIWDTVS